MVSIGTIKTEIDDAIDNMYERFLFDIKVKYDIGMGLNSHVCLFFSVQCIISIRYNELYIIIGDKYECYCTKD